MVTVAQMKGVAVRNNRPASCGGICVGQGQARGGAAVFVGGFGALLLHAGDVAGRDVASDVDAVEAGCVYVFDGGVELGDDGRQLQCRVRS